MVTHHAHIAAEKQTAATMVIVRLIIKQPIADVTKVSQLWIVRRAI